MALASDVHLILSFVIRIKQQQNEQKTSKNNNRKRLLNWLFIKLFPALFTPIADNLDTQNLNVPQWQGNGV